MYRISGAKPRSESFGPPTLWAKAAAGGFVELQGTAEGHAFSRVQMNALLDLAEKGIGELLRAQRAALEMGV